MTFLHFLRPGNTLVFDSSLFWPNARSMVFDGVPVRSAADLGDMIQHHRRYRLVNQRQLAARAEVSRQWLSQLERGNPGASLGSVLRVLGALHLFPRLPHPGTIPVEDLLYVPGQDTPLDSQTDEGEERILTPEEFDRLLGDLLISE